MNVFIKSIFRSGVILLLLLCIMESASSQERSLTVVGTAEYNLNPLSNTKVTLLKDGNVEQTLYTSSDGLFRISLSMNENYTILLEKPGLLSKKIAFNTELPDDLSKKWTIEFAMTLFKGCEGVNTSILDQPVDMIKFSANKSEFISDKSYVEKMRSSIEKLLIDIDNCETEKIQALTKQADDLFAKKQYEEARNKYEEVLKVYPEDTYSKNKISEINAKIGQDKQAEQKYASAIQEADQLYANKSFELAKAKYLEASKIKPSDTYSREKIATIDNLLVAKQNAEQEKLDKEKNYNSLIAKANLALNNKDLEGAKKLYQQALIIKPDASFPQQKIKEIEPLIVKQQQQNSEKAATLKTFNEEMALGQAALQKNDFETAKQHFNKALLINPQSVLPQQKIAETDKLVAQQKEVDLKAQKSENEKKIVAALDEGDMYFQQKNYEAAEAAYQRALKINPNEVYAKQRIDKIMSFKQSAEAEKQKTLEKSFNESIVKADNLMVAASYQQAVEAYKQALLQKPNDAVLKNKLTGAEQKLAEEKKKQSSEEAKKLEFDQFIVKGNNFLMTKNYIQAKTEFQNALALYPDQAVPKNKIVEIDKILAGQKQIELYKETISKADGQYAAKDYSNAKNSYQQAMALKSDEIYPQQKITEIDKIINDNKKLASEQAARDEQFRLAVTEGDKLMVVSKITEAKVSYQKALVIKPADQYAKSQIAKIDGQIAEQLKKDNDAKAKELQYNSTITQADQLFAAKKNTEAKAAYMQALILKPGEQYPVSQISKIDALNAEQLRKDNDAKAIELQYNSAVSQADQLFAAKKNTEAKAAYQKALILKPGEIYPVSQISKVDALIAEQLKKDNDAKARELQYNSAITKADQLYNAKKNTEAKAAFQQALLLKPGEQYPASQISKIDALIAEQLKKDNDAKAMELQYSSAISRADQLFAAKKNSEAKTAYQQALTLKPGDQYPTAQIAKIDALTAEQLKKDNDAKSRELQYSSAISQADQLFAAKKNAEAKAAYLQALTIKPGEQYPIAQMAKIDALIAEQLRKENDAKAKELQYSSAIAQADQLYNSDKLIEAKAYYEQALKIKTGEQYPTSQIQKISARLVQADKEKQAREELEKNYNLAIQNGDLAYSKKEFDKSRGFYNQALTMKPNETYPKERLNKITDTERILAQEQASKKQVTATSTTNTTKPKSNSKLLDLKFANDSERDKYLNGLREKYPVGVTLEVHKEEFKTTNRYIVIRDNEVREFRKVIFNYGGVEFSINGIPATGQYFDSQVKPRAGELFQELEM